MIFNPLTQDLFTDSKVFIKTLQCPYQLAWEELTPNDSTAHKTCHQCQHTVLDTESLSDDEVLSIVQLTGNTCLKVDFNQPNIKISTSI